ncbi:cell division protein FtsW [Bifidobacterium aemilianum]|uniref:Probable peptidoglycan glycosyltransferase FtsW n=1 Tax=Bifidobacterium aemilianum TaxID=2493120 RepID=A0A366K9X9_9BIFI|nr:putative peptidoglycan glycosyltransferase FtsW [Bifidobacterium aemilianum]RBP98550.1 cell division protein FtsW [Bifidobacterium aemilianum]
MTEGKQTGRRASSGAGARKSTSSPSGRAAAGRAGRTPNPPVGRKGPKAGVGTKTAGRRKAPAASVGSDLFQSLIGAARSAARSTGRGGQAAGGGARRDPVVKFADYQGIRSIFNPLWCYHGFRVAVAILTCFGVIMVFSSSSVTMISQDLSPWKQAFTQGIYCVLGILLGLGAMAVPVAVYRKLAPWLVVGSICLQLLTLTPLGVQVNGNTGWIGIRGVFTMQPAEVVKLSLCVWLPASLSIAGRHYEEEGIKAYTRPIVGYAASLLAIMLGKDLGTAMIVVIIGAVAFIIGGFPGKWLAGGAAALLVVVALTVVTSPNRMKRIMAAYQGCSGKAQQNVCYQALHAKYAMGSGGLFGVGIGNSREKWNYLPEAHNDFIFAIIGEETGFIGAALVIIIFAILGWCMICVALQTGNRYVSMVLVCITVWIVGQALINIMVVVGLLPVMGVPLPFVSAGGSSLVMCLIAAGVAASMMRQQPEIRADAVALHS